ncbi:tRNA 2-selenouridine(34) synthase MnmH [Mastigocladus laminosus UU774]|nr:tRNA 2-selenouridine(34) synthase MnmH [Westiellopsis prolifica IICB1]TFI51517.1 tRNA 2-selenouridine(34) synthase MnmH [Mastigocladus laminosus UU774]
MPPLPTYTQQPQTETYTEIIDVRSPREFSEDHIPGAINLPVLNNSERTEIGTIYKQINTFQARKIGAALVTKNISEHITQHFAKKEKSYHPLVYCWRGGQPSLSMALVLGQIGWRVTLLEGGYKTYRAYVRQQIEELPKKFTYKILCGLTGSGKTYILRQMRERGTQVLDLENLAQHRGSVFGEEWQDKLSPQPTQKYFESLLLQQLQSFNPKEPVWIESESRKIGKVYLPKSLWEKMKQACCVDIQLPLTARVKFLLQKYSHFVEYPEILKAKLEKLKDRYGWEKVNQWYQLIDAEKWELLIRDILSNHYDPTYRKSIQRNFSNFKEMRYLYDLSDESIHALLDLSLW